MHIPALLLASLAALATAPAAQDGRPRAPRPGQRNKEKERLEPLVALPEGFVRTARVPGGGRAPRLAARGDTLALLALAGEGAEAGLVLATSHDEGVTFGEPARLAPAGVPSWGDLHAGALDVGPDGRVHVSWIAGEAPGVLCYTAASPEGVPGATVQLGTPEGLCGTTAVAVDGSGAVFLFFVAADPAREPDADGRRPGLRVWMRRSTDGASFAAPVPVDKDKHDVSPASGIAAHVDATNGAIYVFYRCAVPVRPAPDAPLTRDMRLLSSLDGGASFESARVDNWKQQRDPATLAALVQDPMTTLAIWEARGAVLWTPIRRQEQKPQLPSEVKDGDLVRGSPAGAGGSGEVLIAWLERPRGEPEAPARIAWRVWERDKRIPLGEGAVEGSEGAGAPAVLARTGGGFTIFY